MRQKRILVKILALAGILFIIGSFVVTFGPDLMAMPPEERSAVLSWMWSNFPKRHLILIAGMMILAIVRKIRRKPR